MWIRSLACLALAASCHRAPPGDPVPHNHAPAGTPLEVSSAEPLGWLAIATQPTSDNSWIPVSDRIGAFTLTDDPLPPHVTVLGARGTSAQLAVGPSVPLRYGCDNNALGVHPLSGTRLPPGPAWIVPPTAPPSWQPAAIAVSRTRGDSMQRSYVAGSLVVTLARKSTSSATFTITHDGREVYNTTVQRAEMDGADPRLPIDLAGTTPGIPDLAAVWSLSPAGPYLLAFLVPGYEGITISAMLVDAHKTRALDDMSVYLYACAF